jgi:hypothetical protein
MILRDFVCFCSLSEYIIGGVLSTTAYHLAVIDLTFGQPLDNPPVFVLFWVCVTDNRRLIKRS